ncbi:MAG: multiheme c-type cytochrome [Myxococcota bacterium]
MDPGSVSRFQQASPRLDAAPTVAMPGPAVGAPARGRAELNAGCVRCHATVAAQWAPSLHGRAWTDGDFAFARVRERKPFCRSCHAPEANPADEPPTALASLGVACVTCHVPADARLGPDGVLTGTTLHGTEPSPHPIVRSAAFDGVGACASCHEFASPRNPGLLLQSTVSEHQRSAYADHTCQSCHMPPTGRGLDHGFSASRDPEMLRSALTVTATRPVPHRVAIALQLGAVGHAFPTGDPFRRVVVETRAEVDGRFVPLGRVPYVRSLENQTHGLYPRRVEVDDSRVGAADDPGVVHLDVSEHADATVHWRVLYERVDQTVGIAEPVVFATTTLASGELPSGAHR